MDRLKKWIGGKWQKFKHSKLFLAIIMLTIGVSFTVSYYEFKDLWSDYQEALKTFERFENKEVGVVGTPVAHASSEQDLTLMVQKEEERALVSSTSPTAQSGIFTAYNSEVGQTDSDPYTMANF